MIYPINVEVAVEYGIMSQHCSSSSHTFLCTVRWTMFIPYKRCDICYVNSRFFSVSLCLVIKYLFQTPYKINCPVQSVFMDPESSVTIVFSWNRIWNLPNLLWDEDFDWTLWQELGLFKTTLFIPPLLSELQDCLLLNTMLVQRNKLTTFCGCDAEEITLNHW